MDQLTIIVKWLGENQAALLAAIATLTAVAPAIVGLWHSLKKASQALDATTRGIERAPKSASAKTKKHVKAIYDLLPPGARKKLDKSILRAGG